MLLSPYTYEDTRSYRVPAGMAVTAGVSFFSPAISERRDSILCLHSVVFTNNANPYRKRHNKFLFPALAEAVYGSSCCTHITITYVISQFKSATGTRPCILLVTTHGALHPAAGHPADNFTVSGIQPLAEGDLEWAGCVTVCGRLGREL